MAHASNKEPVVHTLPTGTVAHLQNPKPVNHDQNVVDAIYDGLPQNVRNELASRPSTPSPEPKHPFHDNVLELVEDLGSDEALEVLRTVGNSALFSAIADARRALNTSRRENRHMFTPNQIASLYEIQQEQLDGNETAVGNALRDALSNDARNEQDAEIEGDLTAAFVRRTMGLPDQETAEERCFKFFRIWQYCYEQVLTRGATIMQEVMSPKDAINFLINNPGQMRDTKIVEMVAKHRGTTIQQELAHAAELDAAEARQLTGEAPTLLAYLDGCDMAVQHAYTTNVSALRELNGPAALDDLNPVDQHQLTVKVVQKLKLKSNRAFDNAVRRSSHDSMTKGYLMTAAKDAVYRVAKHLETKHRALIREAMELRNIQLL